MFTYPDLSPNLIGAICATLFLLALGGLGVTPESHVYLMYEGVYCV